MDTQQLERYKNPLLVLSVLILVWGVFGALDVRNQTYGGYGTDGNNTITQVAEGGPADVAGFETGDIIRSIGGIVVDDWGARARRGRPAISETRVFEVERDGNAVSLEMTYAALPTNNALRRLGGVFIGVLFLGCGVWAFLVAPGGNTALLAVLGISLSPFLTVGPYFASPVLRNATGTIFGAWAVVGFAVLMHFVLVFPKAKRILERRNMIWVIYGPAALVGLLCFWVGIVQPNATGGLNAIFPLLAGLLVVAYFGTSLIAMVHSYVKASPQDRVANGLNLLLTGTVVGLGPTLVILIVGLVAPQVVVPGARFLLFGVGLLPVMFAFAAVRGARATQQA